MRILVATLNYAPELTGTAPYNADMAEWLTRRGHHVTVTTAPAHYPEWRVRGGRASNVAAVETRGGVRIERSPVFLRSGNGSGTLSRVLLETSYTLSAARWWIPRMVQRTKADVVVAVCPPLQAAVWPTVYRTVRRVPWVLHVQDLQVDAAVRLGMIQDGWIARTLFAEERRTLLAADLVTSISGSMLDRIRAKGVPPERTAFFPNWSDLTTMRPRPADPSVRAAHGAADGDVLVMYSGNMGKKQGIHVIVDAARALQDLEHVKISIVGEGGEAAALRAAVERAGFRNVRFHDLVPSEDLPALLAAADVHLVVQRRDAADLVMPSKLTNILASGRPAIATADPGTELHDVLTTAEAGVVVPPEDPDALAESIRWLADRPDLRRDLGHHARAHAERTLDKDVILERFEATLARQVEATS